MVGRTGQRGSAPVDFVLVGVLVLMLVLAVMQLALALYVRNTLIWAAGEGARVAARAGADPQEGVSRTRELVTDVLAAGYAQNIEVARTDAGSVAVVEITIVAPTPVLGLLGPGGTLTAVGRAFDEVQP